jgi:isopenicillin-N epimerase
MQPLLEPLVVSWGWDPELPPEGPGDEPIASRLVRHHEWQGTRDLSAFLAVPAAIRFMEARDWPQVRRECHGLLRHARRSITALTGLEPITPDAPEWFSQMASFPLPPCDAKALGDRLAQDFGIQASVPTWNGRQFVRVSVQGYNTRAEVDALVAALEALLSDVA